jgi:hypothetical protein
MVDYVRLAATAQRLITNSGRTITLVQPGLTALDPAKPWDGPGPAETKLPIPGTFVPPNTVRQFGLTALGKGTEFQDLIAFSEQIIIAYPGSADVSKFVFVRDGNIDWNIIGVQSLTPGDTQILAFIGVRR